MKLNVELNQKTLIAVGGGIVGLIVLGVFNPLAIGTLLIGFASGYVLRPKLEPVLSGVLKNKKDEKIKALEQRIKELEA